MSVEVIKEMLVDRGYFAITEFENQINAYNDSDEKIIIFLINKKVNVEYLKNCTELLSNNNIKNCIIISDCEITPKGKLIIETINKIGEFKIEFFSKSEFQYNRTKHRLVPIHIKLNKLDKEIVIKKYGHLSEMLVTDAIAKYYGYEKGDVIKIIRKDNSINYRIVI